MPSSTISRPPPPPSSAGWKITTAVPEKFRVSARYLAPPSSIAVCPSWPQACILPGFFDRYGRLVCSSIGSASISARSPITLRGPVPFPWITPTTPVLPMPVTTSSQPKALSFSATLPAVRCTSNRISGYSWMSRRHAATSAFISAIRLAIGIRGSGAQQTLRQFRNEKGELAGRRYVRIASQSRRSGPAVGRAGKVGQIGPQGTKLHKEVLYGAMHVASR